MLSCLKSTILENIEPTLVLKLVQKIFLARECKRGDQSLPICWDYYPEDTGI